MILELLLSTFISQASAQNPTCPTRPFGDSSNACASTAFVQTAVNGIIAPVVCHGIDDTATIQAAINALSSGGTVQIPTGTCVTTSPLTIGNSNIALTGQGRTVSIIQSSAAGSAIVVNTGLTGIQITDLQVKRTDIAAAGRDCIHFNNQTERAYVARVDLVACYNGLRLGITGFSTVDSVFANNNQSHGIYVTNADGAGGVQWQIFNTLSQQNNGDGFRMEAVTSNASVGQWVNNYTFANKGKGMRFLGTAGTPFRLQGPRLVGGFIGQDCDDEIYLDTYGSVSPQIEGVYAELAGTSPCGVNQGTAATNVGSGILITSNNTDVAVTNSVVIQNSGNGIQTAATFSSLIGNTSRLNGQAAIAGLQSGIQIDAGQAVVTGNTSIGNTMFGLRLLVDNVVVIGNNLCANTSAAIASIPLSISLIEDNQCQNSAAVTLPAGTLTLANGLNSNIASPGGIFSYVRVAGPTGAFSIGGITNGTDGRVLKLFNPLSQTMTIVNEDASSTAGNRITTLTGANIVLPATTASFVTFIYDGTNGRWIVSDVSGTAVGNITGLSTGIATWLATPSSANLAAALTDETGSGAAVFGTSPTFTTSWIGSFGGTSNVRFGAVSNYNILTLNNTLTLAGGMGMFGGASGDANTLYINAPNAVTYWFNGVDTFHLGTGGISPTVDNSIALGDSTHRWINVFATAYSINAKLAWSGTAPTINTGFCTSPSISNNNGTAAFTVTIGSACAASTGVLNMPSASVGWACNFRNVTNNAANAPSQTASTQTTVSVTNYVRTTGVAGNWTASDVIVADCAAY